MPTSAVVICRASDRASAELLAESMAKRAGVREVVVQDGPCGPAHARNVGAARTDPTSTILAFLDADVRYVSGSFRELEDRSEGCWSPTFLDGTGGDFLTRLTIEGANAGAASGQPRFLLGPCQIVRKSWFRGYVTTRILEDAELGRELQERGCRMGIAPLEVSIERPFTPRTAAKVRRDPRWLTRNTPAEAWEAPHSVVRGSG